MNFIVRLFALCLLLLGQIAVCQTAVTGDTDLWNLAQKHAKTHRFSTLFTAQDVRQNLSDDEGRKSALNWCRKTAVTHLYVESFRDGYTAERASLLKVKELFEKEGFLVSGCITPTRVGKSSTGWKDTISCYTDKPTQEKLKTIFEYAAGIFDEIMIDDFWFTDCACSACDDARMARKVTLGDRVYPVSGDTWENYRCELMFRLSQEYLLKAAKRVNPKAKLIIKYPQWYDRFHERGYEVIRETSEFDKIWVGTETRDYTDTRWGGTPQYEAYFIMRWLGGIGGKKCGGGWFDPYGTRESTYLEQARQTVLGGAKETVLFCYGSLLKDTGPNNILALRTNVPSLLAVAEEVAKRKVVGVAAYKPANSAPGKEARIFDFLGMLGVPLVPCHQFPDGAPAAFFSVHAMKDQHLTSKLQTLINKGKRVLVTDGLVKELQGRVNFQVPNVRMLLVKDNPKSLLELPENEVELLREHLLSPLKTTFRGPKNVGYYMFKDHSWVVENFNDSPVVVELDGNQVNVASRDWICRWR